MNTNNNDLISRKDALDTLALVVKTNTPPYVPREARRALKNIPAVDAVPVVRCQDCAKRNYSCSFEYPPAMEDDFFCADGERR